MVNVFVAMLDSLILDGPRPFRSPPNVIPPLGPNPGVMSICGDETECFKPLLCSIDGNLGDARPSPKFAFVALVFKLNRLGFFRGFNGGGLMKEGEDGSEAWKFSAVGFRLPRLRARLFGFLNFLGEGDVIGRPLSVGD